MTTFPSITGNKLIRALQKFGFEVMRKKGSHHFLQHKDGRCTVVPIHRGETIGRGLRTDTGLYGAGVAIKSGSHLWGF